MFSVLFWDCFFTWANPKKLRPRTPAQIHAPEGPRGLIPLEMLNYREFFDFKLIIRLVMLTWGCTIWLTLGYPPAGGLSWTDSMLNFLIPILNNWWREKGVVRSCRYPLWRARFTGWQISPAVLLSVTLWLSLPLMSWRVGLDKAISSSHIICIDEIRCRIVLRSDIIPVCGILYRNIVPYTCITKFKCCSTK